MLTPPILFLVFNRPDTTARVFDAIRAAQPTRLYIAADGPRADRPGEAERCAEVRRIATAVDWPCEVKTLFRDRNLGCRLGVGTAIDWFFEHEQEGIILEDDTLPDPTFFEYCAQLLERYRDDGRVMAVCGGGYGEARRFRGASYAFSRVFDPWGWASWRRAWEKHDDSFPGLDKFGPRFRSIGPTGFDCNAYWLRMFEKTRAGIFDSWAFPWVFSIFKCRGLVTYPSTNLISNLGFRADATHTLPRANGEPSQNAEMPIIPLRMPMAHPRHVRNNLGFEIDFYKRRLELTRLSPMGLLRRAARRKIAAGRASLSPYIPSFAKAKLRAWKGRRLAGVSD